MCAYKVKYSDKMRRDEGEVHGNQINDWPLYSCAAAFGAPGRHFMVTPAVVSSPDDDTIKAIVKSNHQLPALLCLQCGSPVRHHTISKDAALSQNCPQCQFDPSKGIAALQTALGPADRSPDTRNTEPETVQLCGAPCSLYQDNSDGGKCLCHRTCSKPLGHPGPQC